MDTHERQTFRPSVREAMDASAKTVHEKLEQKLITEEEHNAMIGEISKQHSGADSMMTVMSSCTMCKCLGFADAGEIGVLSDRLAKLEARLNKIEAKP